MESTLVSTVAVRLTSLGVRDFRNVAGADLEWPAGGAVIIGANGQGKTNILEAIHYGHGLRSMRGATDADAVRFGASAFHLAFTASGARVHALGIGAERASKRKRIVSDGAPVARQIDAFGAIPSVVLSPRDADVVHGSPRERRHFLDLLLAAISPSYLAALQRYRHALAQRNAVLRDQATRPEAPAMAAAFDGVLATTGATIWATRRDWIRERAARFTEYCAEIGERETVTMRHHTGLGEALDLPDGALRDLLRARLSAGRSDDLRRGMTQVGPHRDDLRLAFGGRSVRTFASAGQQRTMALALRLLEWETLSDALRTRPILLLDDPFAELDRARVDRILGMLRRLEDVQRILVVPREDEVPGDFTALPRWTIREGVIDVG